MQEAIYKELLEIADRKGIVIIDDMLKSPKLKGLYIQNGELEFISLNPSLKDDLEYRNFVLAHELGHQELHKGKINQSLYFNNEDINYRNKLEDEADNYADTLINKIIGGLKGGV